MCIKKCVRLLKSYVYLSINYYNCEWMSVARSYFRANCSTRDSPNTLFARLRHFIFKSAPRGSMLKIFWVGPPHHTSPTTQTSHSTYTPSYSCVGNGLGLFLLIFLRKRNENQWFKSIFIDFLEKSKGKSMV